MAPVRSRHRIPERELVAPAGVFYTRRMSMMEFLRCRQSVPARQLAAPGPDAKQLEQLLSLALRVPDHGKLEPWRMLLLEGDAKREFGRRLADMHQRKQPNLASSKLQKDRERYEHAPLVIVVIARIEPDHPKIPAQEQLLSAGYVAYNLLLGAQAMGFGAQLLTGWAAYDEDVVALLGLTTGERVVGFVHVGTPAMSTPDRARPDIAAKVHAWQA